MTVDEGYEWDWTETAREVLVPWRPFGLGDADQPLLPPEDFSRVLVIQHPGGSNRARLPILKYFNDLSPTRFRPYLIGQASRKNHPTAL